MRSGVCCILVFSLWLDVSTVFAQRSTDSSDLGKMTGRITLGYDIHHSKEMKTVSLPLESLSVLFGLDYRLKPELLWFADISYSESTKRFTNEIYTDVDTSKLKGRYTEVNTNFGVKYSFIDNQHSSLSGILGLAIIKSEAFLFDASFKISDRTVALGQLVGIESKVHLNRFAFELRYILRRASIKLDKLGIDEAALKSAFYAGLAVPLN
ncbi:MAG: hypothetical protein HRU19_30410 [Pseudobacteriovorax sp.]|nr:hypothetical protein [Pseudobacteriovorax sp.]